MQHFLIRERPYLALVSMFMNGALKILAHIVGVCGEVHKVL